MRPHAADEAASVATRDAPSRAGPPNRRAGGPHAQGRSGGEERAASPAARPRDSRRSGRRPPRADAARTVAGYVVMEEISWHGEAGRRTTERGRGRGTAAGTRRFPRTRPARPPRQLARFELAGSIMRRGGAGHQPRTRHPPWTRPARGRPVSWGASTVQPRSRSGAGRGISRCLGRVADQNGAAGWRQQTAAAFRHGSE